MPTVLVQGAIAATRIDLMRRYAPPGWTVLVWDPATDQPDMFPALAAEADVIVGGGIPVPWPDVPNLKLFQIPWTGHDFTSPDRIPAGVPVANTFEHETAIAEYVLLAMLEWEIGLKGLDQSFREKGWGGFKTGTAPSHGEVYGKTLGIIGYGHIGHETAMRARAFGMECIGVRRSRQICPPELNWLGQTDRIDALLAESDFVLVSCDMNDETIGMIDAARLASMKPTGVIINVARGKIIVEEDLFDALSQKRIGGAVIDTWYSYDPDKWPSSKPFHELDNVILSAHRSATTEAMHDRRWRFVADNCARVVRGERPLNVVFTGTGKIA